MVDINIDKLENLLIEKLVEKYPDTKPKITSIYLDIKPNLQICCVWNDIKYGIEDDLDIFIELDEIFEGLLAYPRQ